MGGLDGRAVCDRVGEGHAELEGIGTACHRCTDDGESGVRCRIAEHDEGDESAFAALLQGLKKLAVAIHD